MGFKSVEIRSQASARQASLSLLSDIGTRTGLASILERRLLPRIDCHSNPPSCSRRVPAALQPACTVNAGSAHAPVFYCMNCMLPASRADSQLLPRSSSPQEKPNWRYRLSASGRASFEMHEAPLPLRPVLQPLDDAVQRWSSFLRPRAPATFLVAVALGTDAPRGCCRPLGDPASKPAIRSPDVAFVPFVLEGNSHCRWWRWLRR